jgi:hypothetical protein
MQTLYATSFLPLRWLTAYAEGPVDKAQLGTLKSHTATELELEFLGAWQPMIHKCTPAACEELARLPTGTEVELRFSWSLADNDRITYQLSHARACQPRDPACTALRAQQTEEHRRWHEWSSALDAAARVCDTRMAADMAAIGFAASQPISSADGVVREDEISRFNTPEMRSCIDAMIKHYEPVVLDSCHRHGCGNNVGGGCMHVAANFQSSRAAAICRVQLTH